jgi:hypothetical protein
MEDAGGLCPNLSLPESRLYYQGADERQASLSYRRECQHLALCWSAGVSALPVIIGGRADQD